ncbi:hypothetical protein A3842_15415 [Paenibacillus sp. P3E]|uniref:DUF6271 family protein n=1 Tax=Paenibacillus sp. P3E TaxID=1349435 RepID=UPI00093B70FD|nr:DUF6271 family protein [Paenibacillus sp. P3E]OKP77920.1 hypothetical protein A3842_15415 [Paenibacillus sp. P3E]
MFAIPTNRLVLPAVQSILIEMTSMQQRGIDPEELIILDNGPSHVVIKNKKDIMALQKTTSIPIIHHDLNDQLEWIRDLAEHGQWDLAELTRLLYPHPEEVDYGKVFNMLYLVAARYGRKVIHRRDSDCFTPLGDETLYPVSGEMQFIGKKVAEVLPMMDTCESLTDELLQEEIWIAGSDYIGDWNVTLELLQQHNTQTLNEFLTLLSIPEARIPAYIDAKYSDGELNFRTRPLLITCEQLPDIPEIVPNYPECGNIAMMEIFKWIPNFIGSHCIGFDYHTYILGSLLKVPAVYHTQRIIHAHEYTRKQQDGTLNYWKGIAKLADYNFFITEFRCNYLHRLALPEENGFHILRDTGPSTLVNLLSECQMNLDRKTRLGLVHDLAHRILLPSGLDEYRQVAEELERGASLLIDELDDDYTRSIKLQNIWRELIHLSEQIGSESRCNAY